MPRIDLRLDPYLLEKDGSANMMKGSAGYPPFDIIRFPDEPKGVFLRITLAVAGFAGDELDILTEDNRLLVTGLQSEKKEGEFLYHGIAGRQFRRLFQLSEGMEVIRAHLDHGLLHIDITRRPSQVRKINISVPN